MPNSGIWYLSLRYSMPNSGTFFQRASESQRHNLSPDIVLLHSDTSKQSRYRIQHSMQESWINCGMLWLILINGMNIYVSDIPTSKAMMSQRRIRGRPILVSGVSSIPPLKSALSTPVSFSNTHKKRTKHKQPWRLMISEPSLPAAISRPADNIISSAHLHPFNNIPSHRLIHRDHLKPLRLGHTPSIFTAWRGRHF